MVFAVRMDHSHRRLPLCDKVRELTLKGPADNVKSVDFPISGDGQWRTYSIPFPFQGLLTQIRVYPAVKAKFVRGSSDPNALESFVSSAELTAILAEYP